MVPAIQRQLGGFGLTAPEYRWCAFDEALGLVNYRGLKEGLRELQLL